MLLHAKLGSTIERCPAKTVLSVYLCSPVKKKLGYLLVSGFGSEMQRRATRSAGLRVYKPWMLSDKLLDQIEVAIAHSKVHLERKAVTPPPAKLRHVEHHYNDCHNQTERHQPSMFHKDAPLAGKR